jgi:hypothetical protein
MEGEGKGYLRGYEGEGASEPGTESPRIDLSVRCDPFTERLEEGGHVVLGLMDGAMEFVTGEGNRERGLQRRVTETAIGPYGE